jgi:hypothetical protein
VAIRTSERPRLRGRVLTVSAGCDEDCRIIAASPSGRLEAPRAIKARGHAAVRVVLSSRTADRLQHALRRRGRATFEVALAAVDGAGNRGTARRTLALRR